MNSMKKSPTGSMKRFVPERLRKQLGRIYADHIGPRFSRANGLPDAVIIGGQKCGTTSLFYCLSQHPEVVASKTKEVHFFDRNYHRGLDWYRFQISASSRATDPRLRFESSPYYLFHPAAPARMHVVLPDAKLIVMLRNPVNRAYSHYWHERSRGREPLSFSEALKAERKRIGDDDAKLSNGVLEYSFNHHRYSYFARGCYAQQIERWFKWFEPDQFLFIESEAFFESPQVQMKRILHFLQLSPFYDFQYQKQNVGRYRQAMGRTVLEMLKDAYRPYNRQLERVLNQRFSWMEGSSSPNPPTK